MATITCPNCGVSKTFELSEYRVLSKAVKLRIKCKCGYTKPVLLERRENFRKRTDLSGSILNNLPDKQIFLNTINIKNLSVNGIRFTITDEPKSVFKPGDAFLIKFNLNEQYRAIIKKEVVIRNYNEPFIGAEFTKDDCDNQLCFRIFLFE